MLSNSGTPFGDRVDIAPEQEDAMLSFEHRKLETGKQPNNLGRLTGSSEREPLGRR